MHMIKINGRGVFRRTQFYFLDKNENSNYVYVVLGPDTGPGQCNEQTQWM